MERYAIAVAMIVAAVVVAMLIERRKQTAAPTQPKHWDVPNQLDRADFAGADTPWLVAVFTSQTCDSCEKVVPKVEVLASDAVAIDVIPWQQRRALHERYSVDVVPLTLVADSEGIVRAHFIGEPSATDLWAAVAEARAPGSSPECD